MSPFYWHLAAGRLGAIVGSEVAVYVFANHFIHPVYVNLVVGTELELLRAQTQRTSWLASVHHRFSAASTFHTVLRSGDGDGGCDRGAYLVLVPVTTLTTLPSHRPCMRLLLLHFLSQLVFVAAWPLL